MSFPRSETSLVFWKLSVLFIVIICYSFYPRIKLTRPILAQWKYNEKVYIASQIKIKHSLWETLTVCDSPSGYPSRVKEYKSYQYLWHCGHSGRADQIWNTRDEGTRSSSWVLHKTQLVHGLEHRLYHTHISGTHTTQAKHFAVPFFLVNEYLAETQLT